MKSRKELLKELNDLKGENAALKKAFDNYIIEHDRNLNALSDREDKFRMLVENLNEILYTLDHNAIITYMSPNVKAIGGYEAEEITGRFFIDFVHPEDVEGRMEQFRKILTGINEPSEYRMITREGKSVWMRTNGRPLIKDGRLIGIQGILTDISDLKNTEKRLNTLISETPAIIYSYKLIDGELHPVYINENIKNILGYSPEDLISNRELWNSCIHPDDRPVMERILINTRELKDSALEYRFKHKNGRYRWLHEKQKIIKNDDGDIEVIGASWDITLRKKAEKEIVKAKQKAEESTRLKSLFLANLSHEIRTPMNGILGFAELLSKPDLTGESKREYLKIIKEGGERMLDTIDQLMNISMIEAGEMKIANSTTNINEQIIYIYNFFKPEAEEKGLTLTYKLKLPDNESQFNTDPGKLYAVLVNLVKNAIKYTNQGSIELGYDIKDNNLLFFVTDTGQGIAREKQEVIFERFRQVDESYSRKHDGIGLGLPISKAYIELLGGKLSLKSKPGKGSSFYFTIPFKGRKDWPASYNGSSLINYGLSDGYDFSGITILVAEDEKINQMYLQEMFKSTNAKIIMASNGQEAIDCVDNNQDIRIALIDIKMPVMDGLEAAQHIKQRYKDLPLIAQTAYSQHNEKKLALEAGFDDIVSKPLKIKELFKLVKARIEEQ